MRAALDNGAPTLLGEIDTIADGLKPVIAGDLTYEHARDLMDDVVTVTDDAIRTAAAMLVHRQKVVFGSRGLMRMALSINGRAWFGWPA